MIKILQDKLMDVENIMKLFIYFFLKHIRAIKEIIKLWSVETREMIRWERGLCSHIDLSSNSKHLQKNHGMPITPALCVRVGVERQKETNKHLPSAC